METVAEVLERGHALYAVCEPCKRMVALPIATEHMGLTLDEIRAKLRCSECGEKTQSLRRVPMLAQGIHGG